MRKEHRKVLLLNADNSILTTVHIRRAIGLYMDGKISVVRHDVNRKIHPDFKINVPIVIRLKTYRHVPFKQVTLTRKRIFQRDRYTCQYCGFGELGDKATIDHVIPISHHNFPGNVWENMVTACKKCNNKKSDRTPKQAGMKLLKHPRKPRWETLFLGLKPEWQEFLDGQQ